MCEMRDKIKTILLFIGRCMAFFILLCVMYSICTPFYLLIKGFLFPSTPKEQKPLKTCEQCIDWQLNICNKLKQSDLKDINRLKSDNPKVLELEKLNITINAEVNYTFCTDRINKKCKEECKNEDNKENSK